uniref:Structural maintenance of chromosomes protein n=1 Tax=Spodoptera frugiperda TaxID=7108 RepID=A0A2H1V4J8_SPOFR
MQKSKKRKVEDNAMEVGESSGGSHSNNNAEASIHEEIDHISDDEEGGVRIGDIYIPPAPKPTCSFDSKGPRLIITHIVNENFKSYAGVEVLGPFHKSFTAIIGPNGSGKSNVIDSMLFVFGYRASKIRSKKISVLIHSSSKYPNLTSTTVAVHFCRIIDGEGEAYEVVPNSEIVVSRTAFRDSSSFYTLNGRRVQFKEVSRMLRSHGIDLDYNRFLILQGEVEQISMMKPKAVSEHEPGMLEYLEDIIGTSRFKEPIEKLAIKVEEYSDLRKEKLNRVRLVEQEKQALLQPMQEAVDLLNMTNTYTRTRNMVLQKYIHETKKIMETKQQNLDECKANLAEMDEKLKKLQEELQEKTGVLKEGTKKYDVLRKKKEELTEKIQACKKNMVTSQADLTQSNKKKKNLDQLIEQEKGKLIELELIPEKNQREIEDCAKLLEKHSEQKAKAEEELQAVVASVRSRTQSLQETKDKLQGKLMELKKIVDDANNRYKLAESELKIYLSTEKKESEKLENIQAAYEKASAALEQKKPLQEELAQSVPQQEKQLNEMNHKLQKLKREEATLISEVRPLRAQIEESRQAMSANTSRNKVLNALMNEKRNGRLAGIFGRLGDLGGIDSKYDVAISTCCGGLDNIVVDTVETAQAAVEFLRRNDVGRATFIALDKQEHLKQVYQNRHTYPENVPRLFDLVKVKDERVLPAFYYALRDTLVANDLEQATRIAYGRTRYRMVSLKGDVIEIAGTMTGGGKQTMRGKMSSSVQQDTSEADPRVIKANEDKLARMEQRLVEVRNEVSELEEALSILQLTVRDNKTTLNKLNIELKNLVEQVPVIQIQIKQQEKKVAASRVDPQQKANLEATVATALKKLEKAKEDASEIESDVREIDEQISAVAGGKVKDLQKAVDDLTKKIDKVNSEMTKLKVSINTSKRNAKKSKDKINQMETDLRETERNIETLNNTKKQLTLDSGKYEKELEELDEQINEGTDEFKELKQEINKLQTTENKIKGERMERKNEVVKAQKSLEDCTSKIPHWEKELRTLKLEDPQIEGIPDLEPVTPLTQHTSEELSEINVEELRNRLTAQKNRIGDKKPNIQAIQDFKAKEELYIRRAAELDEITNRRNEMRALHDELRKKRMTDFLAGFNTITGKLKEMYQMITLGGDAELELVDSLDPFTEGIIFSVRPPNKSWKNISNLSGGEKTLSSLALVFALHYYKPTPLYVMDEIDAALDFKNVSIVANYIKDRTKNAQFIIISLRYNMFEASNRLVGIYKTEDCTHCVAINNEEFDQPIGSLVEGQRINV